jgi:hypothetical protein
MSKETEARIGQLVALIEAMIQDHIILSNAREEYDDEHIQTQRTRLEQSRVAIRRLLEQFLL